MRAWSAALLTSALFASLVLPANAAGDEQLQPLPAEYDRYLRDHLDIPVRGVPDEVFHANAAEVRAATTEGVHQNGACYDEKVPLEVGAQETFWVYDYNVGMQVERPFTLAAVSDHAYVWVDTSTYDPVGPEGSGSPTTTAAEAEAAAAEFDKIWDLNREYFGEPARCDKLPYRQPPRMEEFWGGPWYDADDDPHINIVNFPIHVNAAAFVAGYYSSADEYPASAVPTSNEGEFFYMNSALIDPGSPTYTGVLAHEFYHMIQFPNDANEETWINEGMADIAIELNGFDVASHLGDYAANPDDQLTHWESELNDYGNAYTYLTYLLEHYGPADDPTTEYKENYALAKTITRVAEDGMAGLNVVLANNPYKGQLATYYRDRTATDVFLDRAIANVLNDTSIADGQYGYHRLSSFSIPAESVDMSGGSASGSGDLHPFADRYLAMDTAADGGFRLEADPEVAVVPNEEGMPSPTHTVWLNRGDEMRTWIEREADLSGTSAPTLDFSYWYQIEEDWDYAYLQVSTDGGQTWENLDCGCGSRTTDPNGNNEGYGITGNSGATLPVDDPSWQTHSQDLSAYAGQVIVIRFAYQTDAAVTEPGFTLDDVSLNDGDTTIWSVEDFEDGPGAFTLDGNGAKRALVTESKFPNEALLQLVKVGRDVDVDRYPASQAGEVIAAEGPMDATRTYALFTSTTPTSSETFAYSWEATGTPLPELTPPVLDDPGDSVEQPFTLTWEAASDAGSLSPDRYALESTDILVDHIVEDAEDLDGWLVSTEGTGAIEWQTRGDKTHSGSNSFWAGALEGATDASAILTHDGTIHVPSEGTTTLEFWNFHMNESDDSVFVEVSTDGERWLPIFQDGRSALPDESAPAIATEPLHRNVTALDDYAGQEVSLRFRFAVGDDNRAGSQPYGWWVDDIRLHTHDWQPLATADGESHTLDDLPAGQRSFRAAALYTDNFLGPWSEPVTTVLAASTSGPGATDGATTGGDGGDQTLPATGGGLALLGLAALAAGGATWRRRTVR